MVDNALLSNSNFVVPVLYLILRLETLRMSYISTLLFDTTLIGLEVSNLVQLVIESGSQPYEGY